MNLIPCVVKENEGKVVLDFESDVIELSEKLVKPLVDGNYIGKKVILGVRPEDMKVEKITTNCVVGEVQIKELLGHEACIHFVSNGINMTASISAMVDVAVGDKVTLYLDNEKLHIFDAETEQAIVHAFD